MEVIIKNQFGLIYLLRIQLVLYKTQNGDTRTQNGDTRTQNGDTRTQYGLRFKPISIQAFSLPILSDENFCKTTLNYLMCSVKNLSYHVSPESKNSEKKEMSSRDDLYFMVWEKPESYLSSNSEIKEI
jgi:hypothetical protein